MAYLVHDLLLIVLCLVELPSRSNRICLTRLMLGPSLALRAKREIFAGG